MNIITTKRSHERTPRLMRETEWKWAPGAETYRREKEPVLYWVIAGMAVVVFLIGLGVVR